MQPLTDAMAAGLLLSLLASAALLILLMRQRRAYRAARVQADRLRNVLKTLSRTNRMIQRLPEERMLWQEACDICVDTGRAVLACIYLREGTLAHRIASAGPAAKILENVPNPLDLNHPEIQKSYTAQVLRDGVRLVSNDYVLDPRAGRWREEAVAQQVRAIAWIPVRRAGAVVATLMLCAGEPDYFDAELLAALDELGEDLSFALDNHDRRRAQLAAQQEIEAGRDRFRRLFECAPVPMAIVAIAERRILEANEALCDRYSKSREAMVGTQTASHAYGLLPEDRDVFYATLGSQGRVRNLVLRVRDAQGAVHQEVFNADPLNYLGMSCCLISSFDLQPLEGSRARTDPPESRPSSP